MKKLFFEFEYIGTDFCGYQKQPNKRTVQQEVEKAIEEVCGKKHTIYASGRTDAGVHSLGQCAHFDVEDNETIDVKYFVHAMNNILPKDISMHYAKIMPEEFDSRFSVKKKSYVYKFYLSRYERASKKDRSLRVNDNVDVTKMQEAVKYFVGTHDFTSFVARKSGKTDFVRTIYEAKIEDLGDKEYQLVICGNGFLYNMVRIIMGILIDVGAGRRKPEDIPAIIEAKNRSMAGKTVLPHGLYMQKVEY